MLGVQSIASKDARFLQLIYHAFSPPQPRLLLTSIYRLPVFHQGGRNLWNFKSSFFFCSFHIKSIDRTFYVVLGLSLIELAMLRKEKQRLDSWVIYTSTSSPESDREEIDCVDEESPHAYLHLLYLPSCLGVFPTFKLPRSPMLLWHSSLPRWGCRLWLPCWWRRPLLHLRALLYFQKTWRSFAINWFPMWDSLDSQCNASTTSSEFLGLHSIFLMG